MAGGAALLGRHRSAERVPGHAYAVPAGEDRIIVEVLNGSGRLGMARTAARLLRREGIDVVYLGNADATGDSTTLFVRRGPRARGDQVRAALRAGRVAQPGQRH